MLVNMLKDLWIWLFNGLVSGSYWICLFVALAAVLMYAAGLRKAGKYIPASFILYFILECLRVGIK